MNREEEALVNEKLAIDRASLPILVCCGDSPDQMTRCSIVANTLSERGYPVSIGGQVQKLGKYVKEGVPVYELPFSEMLPATHNNRLWFSSVLERKSNFETCIDMVRAEVDLMRRIGPALVISDGRPTANISASLQGIDLGTITPPGYRQTTSGLYFFGGCNDNSEVLGRCAQEIGMSLKVTRYLSMIADFPNFYDTRFLNGEHSFVGPMVLNSEESLAGKQAISPFPDETLPTVYLSRCLWGDFDIGNGKYNQKIEQLPCNILVNEDDGVHFRHLPKNMQIVSPWLHSQQAQNIDLFVGKVNIRLIFPLLKRSIPVIGCPEFSDDEPIMDKLGELRMGLRISHQELKLEYILERMEGFMKYQAALKVSCEEFNHLMEAWWTNGKLGEAVDKFFESQSSDSKSSERNELITEVELIHKLEMYGPFLGSVDLSLRLQQYLEKGLPFCSLKNRRYYEWSEVYHWILDHDPEYRYKSYMYNHERRGEFFVLTEQSKLRCKSEKQRYRVKYTYRFDVSSVPLGGKIRFCFPYPVSTEYQKDIQLLSVAPTDLESCYLPNFGFFYGFEVERNEEPSLVISYEIGVTNLERVFRKRVGAAQISVEEREQYLKLPPNLKSCQDVVDFRNKALGRNKHKLSDEEKVRSIYETLFLSKRWRGYRVMSFDLPSSVHAVLNMDGGNCISLIRTFVALCRLEGIPAREVRACRLNYPVLVYGKETGPPFRHMYGEVFLEEFGWIPIESASINISTVSITEDNTQDPGLRSLIEKWTRPALDYYFGNLDHGYLVGPNDVDDIPFCAVKQEFGKDLSGGGTFQPIELPFECEQVREFV